MRWPPKKPPSNNASATTNTAAKKTHPLEFVSGYKFIGREKRWGNVPVYKVCTKIISEIMRCELAPHAELTRWRMLDEVESQVGPNVIAIAWIRRARKDEIELAVTTALMLDRVPVILRAFEP